MAFCPNCGAEVVGNFCAKCGAAVSSAAGPATAPPAAQASGLEPNLASALCYLAGLVTGVIFLLIAPYNQNRTIRFHAFQSIFFNLAIIAAVVILSVLSLVLTYIPILGWMIGILLTMAVWLGSLVLWIYLMVSAYQGKQAKLPVIGPLAEKQA